MFKPKIGSEVSLYYDGKGCREVIGTVLKTKSGKILVEFDEWAGDGKGIRCWFHRTSNISFGGYAKVDCSIMKGLFGLDGDWYSVYRRNYKTC